MADISNNSTLPLLQQASLVPQSSPHHFRLNPCVFSSSMPSNGARKTLKFSSNNAVNADNSLEPSNFPGQASFIRSSSLGDSPLMHSLTEHSLQPSLMNPSATLLDKSSLVLECFQQSFSAINLCHAGSSSSSSTTVTQQSSFPSQALLQQVPVVASSTASPQSVPLSAFSTLASSNCSSVPIMSLTSLQVQPPPLVQTGPALSVPLTPQISNARLPAANAISFSEPIGYARTNTCPGPLGSTGSAGSVSLYDASLMSHDSRRASLLLTSKTYHTLASIQREQAIKCSVFVTESGGSDAESDVTHLSDKWDTEESESTIGSINDDDVEPTSAQPEPEPNPSDPNQKQQERVADAAPVSPMLVDDDSPRIPRNQSDPNATNSDLNQSNTALRPATNVERTVAARVDENTASALTPNAGVRQSQEQRKAPESGAERSGHVHATSRSPALSNSSRNNTAHRATPPPAGARMRESHSGHRSARVTAPPSFSESRDAEWEQHEDEEADREVRAIGRRSNASGATNKACANQARVQQKTPPASASASAPAHATDAQVASSHSAQTTAEPSRALQRSTSNVAASEKGARRPEQPRATSSFSVLLMPLANKARVLDMYSQGKRLDDVKKLPGARFLSISPQTEPSEEYEIEIRARRCSLLNIKFNRRGLPIRPLEITIDDWNMQLISDDSIYLMYLMESSTSPDASHSAFTTPRSSRVSGPSATSRNSRAANDTSESFSKKRPISRRRGERRMGPPLKRFRRLHISSSDDERAGADSAREESSSSESTEPTDEATPAAARRALFSRSQHSSLLNSSGDAPEPSSARANNAQATEPPVTSRRSSSSSISKSSSSSASPPPANALRASQSSARPSAPTSSSRGGAGSRVSVRTAPKSKEGGNSKQKPRTPTRSSKRPNVQPREHRVKFFEPASPYDFNEKDSESESEESSSSPSRRISRRGPRSSAQAGKRRPSNPSRLRGPLATTVSSSSFSPAGAFATKRKLRNNARVRRGPYQLRELGPRSTSEQEFSASVSASSKRMRRSRSSSRSESPTAEAPAPHAHAPAPAHQQRHSAVASSSASSSMAPSSTARPRNRVGRAPGRRSEPTAPARLQPFAQHSLHTSIAPGSQFDDADVALLLSSDE